MKAVQSFSMINHLALCQEAGTRWLLVIQNQRLEEDVVILLLVLEAPALPAPLHT